MNLWETDATTAPLTARQIDAWEQQTGCRVPSVLRAALLLQNGGQILDTLSPTIDIRPLEEWHPIDEDILEMVEYQGPPHHLIAFADSEYGCAYFLHYGRCDSEGEPLVGSLENNSMNFDEGSRSVTDFISQLAKASPEPTVHGGLAAHLSRLAECRLSGGGHTTHRLLGRDQEGLLIQMEYFTGPDEERWSATLLPEPLKRHSLKISHTRYYGTHGYELSLSPQHSDGIREWSSARLPSGRWKNDLCEGAPVYTTLYSADLESLALIRQLLAGPPQTQHQADADALRLEYLRHVAAWPQAQKEAADLYISKVEGEAAFKSLSDDLDADLGTNADEGEAETNEMLKSMSFFSGGMVEKLYSTVTTMMGGSSVPEATRNLIDRMVAAEAAVEAEDD